MKRLRIVIIVLMVVTSFNFIRCSKIADSEISTISKMDFDKLSFDHSMKGWELYSWPNGNDYNYSILMGTNRAKSYEEITSNKIIVFGKSSLKMLLDKFPAEENIFWFGKKWIERSGNNNYEFFAMPGNETINEIKEYCTQKKLTLIVSD